MKTGYVIALDAGHGGNRGARSGGLLEDEITLNMVARIGHHIRLLLGDNVKTIILRPTEDFVPLQVRTSMAKQAHADLLLSIHVNADGYPDGNPRNGKAFGVEAYIAAPDVRSGPLAEALVKALKPWGDSRGVKKDNQGAHKSLFILRDTYQEMKSVLLELLFIDNKEDRKNLQDKHAREGMAEAIAKVVVNHLQG